MRRWVTDYPKLVAGIHDSAGRVPQHTFFVPEDEYDPRHVDQISRLCRQGYGDVEVHLHHENDSSQALRAKLECFIEKLHNRHGLLRKDEQGRIRYGFIHGNWALDNSHPDGRYCGVNDEISILSETGCYADFTLPSAPSHCQTKSVNSIYYATDDPLRPSSHERGQAAAIGRRPPPGSLLMIQGPLQFDIADRKWGFIPRVENGDLTGRRPPTLRRFHLWCRAGVAVQGRPDWVFVKVYTHGCQERNAEMLLGQPMRTFHEQLRAFADAHRRLKYYYVTAAEMAQLVHQAEIPDSCPSLRPAI